MQHSLSYHVCMPHCHTAHLMCKCVPAVLQEITLYGTSIIVTPAATTLTAAPKKRPSIVKPVLQGCVISAETYTEASHSPCPYDTNTMPL